MASEDTERLVEIVGEAMLRAPGGRQAYVREACPEPAAQREALSLLAALERAGGFLERPTVVESEPIALGVGPGSMVGRYKLLDQIGEGGFGVVFSAEQREPVHRIVALKIIKLGMDTRAVVARFEAERQTLALMDHPCIAKVLDGGATDTGRPFFVMELVKGEPITRYCDAQRLAARQRLDLFVQVCRAVQHAHTKGIIHRDLKPANVLVTEVDDRPVPRIIDFGIAKATAASLTEKAAFTELRQFVGTPEYMSPEQSPGSDIDTRTDIYSLGVLLYELLTGVTPLDPARLRSAAWDQMLRIIREEDPPKPSTRISSQAPVASDGRPPTRQAAAYLRGDLDWIVMRCLEKDRARRYQTADGLAADLERHMSGEAVLAAPPGGVYKFRKFVGRHRAGVGAAGVTVAALVIGLSAALWQADIAARERDAAKKSAGEALDARNEAFKRQKETEQVATFQALQLEGIDLELMGSRLREDLLSEAAAAGERLGLDESQRRTRQADLGRNLSGLNLAGVAVRSLKRNIFERAIAAIETRFDDQPRVQADLLLSTGYALAGLGLYNDAIVVQARALDIYRRELGDEHAQTLKAYHDLGFCQQLTRDFDQSEANLRRAVDGRQRVLGDDARETLLSMSCLAELDKTRRRLAEAERGQREVLIRLRRAGRADDADLTVKVLTQLSTTLVLREKLAEAESFSRQAVDLSRKSSGDESDWALSAVSNLAAVLLARGNLSEATTLAREDVRASRRKYGDQHPALLASISNLATTLTRQDRFDEAEPLYREVLEKRIAQQGEGHPSTLGAVNNYGVLLRQRGRHAEAADMLGRGVRMSLAGGDAALPIRAMLLHHQADALRMAGRLDEAKPVALESVGMYIAHPDWPPREALHANQVLREVLMARGEYTEAEDLLQSTLDRARRAQPPAESEVESALTWLGVFFLERKNYAAAEPVWRECLEIRWRTFPKGNPERWRYFLAMNLLGGALTGQARDAVLEPSARSAKLQEAERLLIASATALRDDRRVPAPRTNDPADIKRGAVKAVVDLYETWHALEPDKGYDAKAALWRDLLSPAPTPRPSDQPGR